MKAEIKGNKLIIEAELVRVPSKTGKSILVATTGGFTHTTAQVDGKPVSVSLNACIKP